MTQQQARKLYPHQFVSDMVAGRELRKHDRRIAMAGEAKAERRKQERRETVQ